MKRRQLGSLVDEVYNLLLRPLPTRVGRALRTWWLLRAGASLHPTARIATGVRVLGARGLVAEAGAQVARDACLDARGGLHLGRGTLVGFESVLLTCTHVADDPERPVQDQGMWSAPIHLGPNSWIGARVMVLPGRSVGTGAVVGSMSVLTRDVPDHEVWAGAPATRRGARAAST